MYTVQQYSGVHRPAAAAALRVAVPANGRTHRKSPQLTQFDKLTQTDLHGFSYLVGVEVSIENTSCDIALRLPGT